MSDIERAKQVTLGARSAADAAWLQLVADDLAPLLGPGVEILELALAEAAPYVLICRYALASTEQTTRVTAATLVEAHAELRRRLVEDRVGLALRALVATT